MNRKARSYLPDSSEVLLTRPCSLSNRVTIMKIQDNKQLATGFPYLELFSSRPLNIRRQLHPVLPLLRHHKVVAL